MVNVLLITLDQFRGDCLSAVGHPLVRTPNIDRLAASGVRFARHYSQAAPCSPGRACLYTGTYQLNNRVVGNGTPLDHRLDNIARAGVTGAGYDPAVLGYTDQGLDPRRMTARDDPRLSQYQGFPPGFTVALELLDDQAAWRAWLEAQGYGPFPTGGSALASEGDRPAEVGVSAFMTDRVIEWLRRRDGPWFAHVSYWRPHPPYAAAGRWASAYDPADVPPTRPAPPGTMPPCGRAATIAAPQGDALRALQAQYFGMISDVDSELGRLWDALDDLGMGADTVVVLTADHGEQLGDQGYLGKGGPFEASYHIPAVIRDPRTPATAGTVVEAFTENVDIFPTICEAIGVAVPEQCDGLPLTPYLAGDAPPWWRSSAHWEYDWRSEYVAFGPHPWPWDRRLDRKHLTVTRSEDAAYVQYGDGAWRCFDLAAAPGWSVETADPARVLPYAQDMLTWRSRHADRTLTGFLLFDGGTGRWPADPAATPAPAGPEAT